MMTQCVVDRRNNGKNGLEHQDGHMFSYYHIV